MASIQVEAWGGGAGGCGSYGGSYFVGGSGGGGAAYARLNAFDIPASGDYTVHVGTGGPGGSYSHGGDSYFIDTATLLAKGGDGVNSYYGEPGGPGGKATECVGDVKYSGGDGGATTGGHYTYGGSGGGAAGSTEDGGNGNPTDGLAGIGGADGGGDGSGKGVAAQPYGGGGQGQGLNIYYGVSRPIAGADGVVIIKYLTADFGECLGGTITTDGDYTIHTFTSSGTFTVVAATSRRIFIIS